MTDLSFLDDGLQTDELEQAAAALAELERDLARTDIPADSEAISKVRENLAFLQEQVRASGQDINAIRKLADEQREAGERLKRDRPTQEQIDAAEQAVDDARAALADGSGTRADLDAAVKHLAELRQQRAKADGTYVRDSEDVRGRVEGVADDAAGRPTELPNQLSPGAGAQGPDSSATAGAGGQKPDLAQQLASAMTQPQQQQGQMPMQVPMMQMPPASAGVPQQAVAPPAASNGALSAADVERLLKGQGSGGSGTRESGQAPGVRASSATRFRPNFSAQPGAGETRTSRFDGAAPATVQAVHTSSDVSGRSQAPAGAFAAAAGSGAGQQGAGASAAGAGAGRGGMPMMPPMGGAGGGSGGGKRDSDAVVDRSGRVHGEDVRESAVEGGSIVSRHRKGGV